MWSDSPYLPKVPGRTPSPVGEVCHTSPEPCPESGPCGLRGPGKVWHQSPAVHLEEVVAAYLALTAHLVPVVQALLLGGTQGVPGHDEVTEGDMHIAIPLGLP